MYGTRSKLKGNETNQSGEDTTATKVSSAGAASSDIDAKEFQKPTVPKNSTYSQQASFPLSSEVNIMVAETGPRNRRHSEGSISSSSDPGLLEEYETQKYSTNYIYEKYYKVLNLQETSNQERKSYGEGTNVTYYSNNYLLLEAENKKDEGKYQEAERNYDGVLAIEPNNPVAFFGKSVAAFKLMKLEEAKSYLDKYLEIEPDNIQAIDNKAVILQELNKNEEALQCFDQALNNKYITSEHTEIRNKILWGKAISFKNLARAEEALKCLEELEDNGVKPINKLNFYVVKGVSLTKLNRYQEAVENYNKSLEFTPGDAVANLAKGIALFLSGRYNEALESYDKAIDSKPNYAFAYNNRGIVFLMLGQIENALESYDKAIEINPHYFYYLTRGQALSVVGQNQKAIDSYNESIKLKPNYDAYICKGMILDNSGREEEAFGCFEKAIEIDPNFHKAYLEKANLLKKLARYEEALENYDKVLELKLEDAESYNTKGDVLKSLGRFDEALKSYSKAIKVNPKLSDAYLNKAVLLRSLGREEEALENYDNVLELKPEDAESFNNKGDVLKNLGRFDGALRSYSKAIETNPKLSEAYLKKAMLLQNLGREEEALECCNKAIELKPQDAESYNSKGDILKDLGRLDEALDCFNMALALNPEEPIYYDNKGAVLLKQGYYHKALEYFEKVKEILPDDPLLMINQGLAYKGLGDLHNSLNYFEKAETYIALGEYGEGVSESEKQEIHKILSEIKPEVEARVREMDFEGYKATSEVSTGKSDAQAHTQNITPETTLIKESGLGEADIFDEEEEKELTSQERETKLETSEVNMHKAEKQNSASNAQSDIDAKEYREPTTSHESTYSQAVSVPLSSEAEPKTTTLYSGEQMGTTYSQSATATSEDSSGGVESSNYNFEQELEVFKNGLDFIENEYENKRGALWILEKLRDLENKLSIDRDQLLEKFNQEQKDKINFGLEYSKREDLTENDLKEGKNKFGDLIKNKMIENLQIPAEESEVEKQIESQEKELTSIEDNILENIKKVRQEEEKKLKLVREFQNFIEGFRDKLAQENNNKEKLNELKNEIKELYEELENYEINQYYIEEDEFRQFKEYKVSSLDQLDCVAQEVENQIIGKLGDNEEID